MRSLHRFVAFSSLLTGLSSAGDSYLDGSTLTTYNLGNGALVLDTAVRIAS